MSNGVDAISLSGSGYYMENAMEMIVIQIKGANSPGRGSRIRSEPLNSCVMDHLSSKAS